MTDQSMTLSPDRLAKLSAEVDRIASTLARISSSRLAEPAIFQSSSRPGDEILAEAVKSAIRARRLRERFFPGDLFADPAWDMMLELLFAELTHRRVSVTSLCEAAAVPPTTALRWSRLMVQKGLFVRRADPLDGRRVFVELAPKTSAGLRDYFQAVL